MKATLPTAVAILAVVCPVAASAAESALADAEAPDRTIVVTGTRGSDGYASSDTQLFSDMLESGIHPAPGIAELKADPATAHIPIILVTMSDNREMGMALGVSDYLSKPVTPEDIAARLCIAARRMETGAARRLAEEELRKARYLAGVGEVAAGYPEQRAGDAGCMECCGADPGHLHGLEGDGAGPAFQHPDREGRER